MPLRLFFAFIMVTIVFLFPLVALLLLLAPFFIILLLDHFLCWYAPPPTNSTVTEHGDGGLNDPDYPERPEDDRSEWNREQEDEIENRFIQWARSVGESEEAIRAHIDEMLGIDRHSVLFSRYLFAASSAFSIGPIRREPLEAAFSGLRGPTPNTTGISPNIDARIDHLRQLHRSGALDCGPDDPEWRNFLMKGNCQFCKRPLRLSNSGRDPLILLHDSLTPEDRAFLLRETCNPRRHSDSQQRINNIPKPRNRIIPPREAVETRISSRFTAFMKDRTRPLRRIFRS